MFISHLKEKYKMEQLHMKKIWHTEDEDFFNTLRNGFVRYEVMPPVKLPSLRNNNFPLKYAE